MRFAVATALVAAAATRASAVELRLGGEPARLDITTTTIGAWHFDNGDDNGCDDHYGEAIERLNVGGFYGAWTVGLRFDASLYFDSPGVRDTEPRCREGALRNRYENQYIPEKIWAGYAGRGVEIVVGDAYVSFGRGLALSLRKVDELGVDTTLRGAKLIVRHALVEGTLVAGATNIANVDEASGRNTDDTHDLAAGVSLQARPGRGVAIGGHAVMFAFHEPVSGLAPGDYEERWFLFGPVIDVPRLTPHWGLYLEGIGQHRDPIDGDSETGWGLYGALTGHEGNVTLLIEMKAYGDLRVVQPKFDSIEFQPVQYTSPPTVERILQVIENPQREIAGWRARVDWSLSRSFVLYASAAYFRDYLGYQDPHDGTLGDDASILDPYAGMELRWNDARSRALVSGGWRFVLQDTDTIRDDGHADYDVVQSITDDLSLELHGVHWERAKLLPDGRHTWREGTAQLGLRWRPYLAGAFVLDYTTEPTQPKDLYPSGTITWDITQASSVRVFVGSSRGGLKCVSGVCRTFPPFDGVKLTATFRF